MLHKKCPIIWIVIGRIPWTFFIKSKPLVIPEEGSGFIEMVVMFDIVLFKIIISTGQTRRLCCIACLVSLLFRWRRWLFLWYLADFKLVPQYIRGRSRRSAGCCALNPLRSGVTSPKHWYICLSKLWVGKLDLCKQTGGLD